MNIYNIELLQLQSKYYYNNLLSRLYNCYTIFKYLLLFCAIIKYQCVKCMHVYTIQISQSTLITFKLDSCMHYNH